MKDEIKILIASILKPVNDTRMLEKMAATLSRSSKYKIFIIGYNSHVSATPLNTKLIPLFSFPRLSPKRIFAPLLFFIQAIKIKPKIIIVNTPELLGAATLFKLLSGCKLIYDIRENYFLNTFRGTTGLKFLRKLIAYLIRIQEIVSSPFVNHFFIAEQAYINELLFIKKKFTLLENKVSRAMTDKIEIEKDSNQIQFLICGTLSQENGLLDGIDFFQKIQENLKTARLEIVGYCANSNTWKIANQKIQSLTNVNVVGGNELVDHEIILSVISKSDYLLMPYKNLPHIANCFPTKIYEAAALGCPVLISPYGAWCNFVKEHNMGMLVDFNKNKASAILTKIQNQTFYSKPIPDNIYWEFIENDFLEALKRTLV